MLFDIIPEHFFGPLASSNRIVYWDCIVKLFSVMDRQLSFGVERDVLVDELQYYFDSAMCSSNYQIIGVYSVFFCLFCIFTTDQ